MLSLHGGVFSDLSHKNRQSWPQCAYPLESHTFTEGQRAHTKLILQCALLMLLFIFIGSPSGNNSVPLLTSSVNVTGKSYKFRVSFHLGYNSSSQGVYSSCSRAWLNHKFLSSEPHSPLAGDGSQDCWC